MRYLLVPFLLAACGSADHEAFSDTVEAAPPELDATTSSSGGAPGTGGRPSVATGGRSAGGSTAECPAVAPTPGAAWSECMPAVFRGYEPEGGIPMLVTVDCFPTSLDPVTGARRELAPNGCDGASAVLWDAEDAAPGAEFFDQCETNATPRRLVQTVPRLYVSEDQRVCKPLEYWADGSPPQGNGGFTMRCCYRPKND